MRKLAKPLWFKPTGCEGSNPSTPTFDSLDLIPYICTMRKWNLENTFDEMLERLDEIEAIEFPDYNTLMLKKDGKFHTWEDKTSKVMIRYSIERCYTGAYIWFSTGGHAYYEQNRIFSAPETGTSECPTKKHAVVDMLNELESFMSDSSNYYKEKDKFLLWCDAMVNR